MTENDKNQIIKLRNDGLGHKKIASILNINANSVKSFLRRNIDNGTRCLSCGKQLETSKYKPRKFCSKDCKEKWWNKNRILRSSKSKISITCPCCNKTFYDYPKHNRVYCSNTCYKKVRYGK